MIAGVVAGTTPAPFYRPANTGPLPAAARAICPNS